MGKFKVGDTIRQIGHDGPSIKDGIMTVTKSDDRYVYVDIGYDGGWYPEKFILVTAAPAITVGDRVTRTFMDSVDSGEVVGLVNAASVRWDKTKNITSWPIEDLAIEVKAAEKTRGQIIQALRKAAGLPEFVVGDVVKIKDEYGGWQVTVKEFNDSGLVLQDSFASGLYKNVDDFELVTPATATPAVAAQPQELKYKKGDFVRFLSGEFAGRAAYIEDVDIDDELKRLPYLVTMVGEYDGSWAGEYELEPWVPSIGEHVEIRADYSDYPPMAGAKGTIVAKDDSGAFEWAMHLDEHNTIAHDCDGATPDEFGRWVDTADIFPTAPLSSPTFKRGDIVEVVERGVLRHGTKQGDLAIVESCRDDEVEVKLAHSRDGIIKQFGFLRNFKLAA